MSIFSKILGDPNKRLMKELGPLVEKINGLEKGFEPLSAEEIKERAAELGKRAREGEPLDGILPEAFALVREAAKRTLSQRHYDVQLMGGIVLHRGEIAEMKTGEGKTLVATLPAFLNALEGKGVHIVTVNDYLSRRDVVWMGQVYSALGLSVGCVNHEASYIYDPGHKDLDKERDEFGNFRVVYDFLRPCSRKEAYGADITYGTNNEFGFDYLRDNIAYDKNQVSQRGHHFAVVDEIDSILIDEARTPLIISAPVSEPPDFYITFAKIAEKMKEGEDYSVDEKMRAISLTDQGIDKAEKLLGVENIYTEKGIKYVHHLEAAVKAKALFRKDKDYVVKDGEIVIVDEFTGRMMPGRRWSEGLHQAMEAKEGVKIQKESRTYASVTFQNYFRMYGKLSGMTGTALTSAEEFDKVYKLEVVEMPTNRPLARKDYPDFVFQTESGKFKAAAKKIKELHETGQPVLVGTVSIEKNEYLSALLKKEGVPHKVLNAKHHEEEGEVVARAGEKGRVTIATNMAGRGVDIVLGGVPSDEEKFEEVKKLGGLFVLGTERHEARRIDNQLRGRAGRQGDPGETQFFVSLEDDLMRIFGSDRIKAMMGRFGIPEDQPIENKMISRAIEAAQTKIEGFNFDSRKHLLEYDDVLNHQRNIIYKRRRKILFGEDDEIYEILKGILESEGVGADELEKKRKEMGDENFFGAERAMMLQAIDMLWVDHLEMMDYMRSSVRLRAYGNRDPLIEYKNEGLRMFRQLEHSINRNIAEMALKIAPRLRVEEPEVLEVHKSARLIGGNGNNQNVGHQTSNKDKVGRNDPCPCGAKKSDGGPIKYKHCCGKNG